MPTQFSQKGLNACYEDDDTIIGIEEYYSNKVAYFFKGWIVGKKERVTKFRLGVNGSIYNVTQFMERPDVVNVFPEFNPPIRCGFELYAPAEKKIALTFDRGENVSVRFDFAIPEKSRHSEFRQDPLYKQFVKDVNDNNFSVLEIGSRSVVHEGRRAWFENAQEYVGFDYYRGEGVDVVGDAHKLSHYFEKDKKFDAICSFFVLEHIAMPWQLVMEVNKLLKIGGITFHATNFMWPMHELPWDFWRFTDNGLSVLFSRPMGYKTLQTSFSEPVSLHLNYFNDQHKNIAMEPGFGCVEILAEKIENYDREKIKFEVKAEETIATVYPKMNGEG